jgi:predicted regulator of Ras-like GTPase activity (Roadblock/LC7/MglB family)
MRQGTGSSVNRQGITQELSRMALTRGVIACALVDVQTGMVYASAGKDPDLEMVAEAASDYWRLHQRNSERFESLGPLRAVSLVHAQKVLTLMPCTEGVVMATISHRMGGLDMTAWYQAVRELGAQFASG